VNSNASWLRRYWFWLVLGAGAITSTVAYGIHRGKKRRSAVATLKDIEPTYDPIAVAAGIANVPRKDFVDAVNRLCADGSYGPFSDDEWAKENEAYVPIDRAKVIVNSVIGKFPNHNGVGGDVILGELIKCAVETGVV
jgi:hypothetical protein